MSNKKEIIEITPPPLISPNNKTESFKTGRFYCPYCGGLGFKPNSNRNEAGTTCGLCQGKKSIAAAVSVTWQPTER